MIAGHIKGFTRWTNGCIYAIVFYVSGCIKNMVIFSIQYSVGMLLSLIGYGELSIFILDYLNSVNELDFGALFVQVCIFIAFYWYYRNSSIDPVVRVKDYSTAGDNCQLENLEIQLNELKEKSAKESVEIAEIQKHFDEELEKSKKVSRENENLKKKVKENETDKKKIDSLQHSIKGYEDEIEIKACELDKLQIALQSAKDNVTTSKSDYKELESKFFNAIKELDIKDCTISDFEEGENEFKRQLSEKDKEIVEKEELVHQLYEQIKGLEKTISDLEEDIDKEKYLSESIRLETKILEETLANINKLSDSETDNTESHTDGEVADELKAERLAMMTDAAKIKVELSETKSELVSCKRELILYKQKNIDLEGKCQELTKKFQELCDKTDELKKTVEKKDIEIATITKFFGERENDLQSLTMSQTDEIQKLTKELGSIGEDKRQIVELNKQIDDLKEEIVSNDKQFKHKVSTVEEESHANYLKMRTAARECDEHKREKEIYRKKLLETDMQPVKSPSSSTANASLSINASLDVSDRESPVSNQSSENAKDSFPPCLPAQSMHPRPPMPFPMFHTIPPHFLQRPGGPMSQRPGGSMPQRPNGPMLQRPVGLMHQRFGGHMPQRPGGPGAMAATPPFPMQPRHAYSGPPRPFMVRQPLNAHNNNSQYTPQGYQQTPTNTNTHPLPPGTSFNGQEYVNTLIDKLATKDNVRKDLFEKQNKTVI